MVDFRKYLGNKLFKLAALVSHNKKKPLCKTNCFTCYGTLSPNKKEK